MEKLAPIHGIGTVVEKNGLGVYIQPDDDDRVVVGFNLLPLNEVPEGLKIGDRVKFVVEDPRDTNATVWSKIEETTKQN